jgi:hypothetical protein
MPTHKLTPEIIHAAIVGFEQQKLRIDAQIAELHAMLPGGGSAPADVPEVPKGKRRKMSAAARKRMSEGQRKRWSASKGVPESPSTPVTPEPAKPKRHISEEGMKRIIAATKKRWAAKRAAAKKAPTKAAAKKAAAKKPQKKGKAPQQIVPAAQ